MWPLISREGEGGGGKALVAGTWHGSKWKIILQKDLDKKKSVYAQDVLQSKLVD